MIVEKPTVHFRSRHESGNIFVILALVRHTFEMTLGCAISSTVSAG